MKTLFAFICFYLLTIPVIAQEDTDQALIRCYYNFSQKKNKNDKDFFSRDTLTLDIGSQISRYYDERKIKRDSAFISVIPDISRITSFAILQNVESFDVFDRALGETYRSSSYNGVSEQIFKNRKTGNITMLNTAGTTSTEWYKGNDPIGTLNWTIESDTAEFLNYTCQKAVLKFRGRDYEAWFAPQIPVNDGPWKFFGLPGLILKVKDTDGQFDFECIGLEHLNAPYTINIPEKKYFECNRNDYNKVMSKRSGGMVVNIKGSAVMIAHVKADPSIQAIELE